MPEDSDLLRQFAERGSNESFRRLVERHSGMVHGTASRIVRDEHLAEEIAQAVFIILARKASRLRHGTILAGWLYRTTRLVALEALRAEQRRQAHHQHFAEMNESSEISSVWERIAPLLEEAMERLRATDRDAVVLRFLEELSFAEVASVMGTSEAAAKMRVGRALEKLRAGLARSGVAVSAAALFGALSTHGALAAPAGLSASLSAAALAEGAGGGSSVFALANGTLKAMLWGKIKAGAALAVLLLTSVFVLVQQQVAPRTTSPGSVFITTLEPLAGEWQGVYTSRLDGQPNPVRQQAELTIRTTQRGRSCEIEMRVSDGTSRPDSVYHFTHALNDSGDRVITVDDPQIGRISGEGVITESTSDSGKGEWRASFRAPHSNPGGFTECGWQRKGDELVITRHDRSIAGQGPRDLYMALQLHRPARAESVP